MRLYMKHMKHTKHMLVLLVVYFGVAITVYRYRLGSLWAMCLFEQFFVVVFFDAVSNQNDLVGAECVTYITNTINIRLFQLFDLPGCAFVQRNLPHRRDCHRQTASGVFVFERPTLPIVVVLRVHRCEKDPRPRRVPIRRATIGEEVFRGPDVWCVCYEQLSIVDRHWCVRVVRCARWTYRY